MRARGRWLPAQQGIFDRLITKCLQHARVGLRIDTFLTGLDAGLERDETWAKDCNEIVRQRGADQLLKNEARARIPRVPVRYDGVVMGRAPREVGRVERGPSGEPVHQRSLFEYLTWDEIELKRAEFLATRSAADVDIAAASKALMLREQVPDSATPHEALEQLGLTWEQFMDQETG